MEEEEQGCHEYKEYIDAPSVTARLSAVSLHQEQQEKQKMDSLSPMGVAHANSLSAMARASHAGASHALCIDVSDGASHATCMDVSDVTSVVSHATQEEAFMKQGDDKVNGPRWAEMQPDALVKIFNCLPLEIILCTIPCVCQSWRFVSQDVPCWQNVDLSEWSYGKQPKTLERMLLLVVNRSRGCLQELCAPSLKNDNMIRHIADSGSQLQVLRIPDSFVSEECLCELAPKFASLTYLDISGRFPSRALIESFGKHCPFIRRLNLNMRLNASNCKSCDVAALSVAQYMPQLKHLEMAYGLLSNVGLKALLENCTSLEHLDLRGCWHVNMDESTILNARRMIKVFLSPVVENDIYNFSDDDDPVDYDEYIYDTSDDYDPVDYDEYIYDITDDDPVDYDEYIYYDLEYVDDNVEYCDGVDIENMDEDVNCREIYMHEEDTRCFWFDGSPHR